LILAGDTPLLQGASLKALLDAQTEHKAACVIGTADTKNNEGLGRVVRNSDGDFECIVEHKDATADQRHITEINTGCYAFNGPLLLNSLQKLKPNNVQAEYYLTDCPRILMDDGYKVAASCSLTIQEAIGVNNRIQLAEVRQHIQDSILNELMLSGVTIVDPGQTSIDLAVTIGCDTVIKPGVVLEGDVHIGANCTIGPNTYLVGPQTIADGSVVA
jgi:bifunctional UDP-N-acetylglucosamine pyrophosphorylase/glucosamine-1-phosphate N-acetyltransferase